MRNRQSLRSTGCSHEESDKPRATSCWPCLSISSIFIRRGGIIRCTVTGCQRYSSDFPQGDLEVPCKLTFVTKIFKEGNTAKKLLESTLSIEVGDIKAEIPPGITCNDGAPTGKVSSGEEQDAQPEPSALIDLTNFENQSPQSHSSHLSHLL